MLPSPSLSPSSPGRRTAEMFLWFCLHASWPLLLGTIYQFSGRFQDKAFMSLQDFTLIQFIVCIGKALFLLPFWWLYFIRLKHWTLKQKVLLHLFTTILYSIVCLITFHWVITFWVHASYTWPRALADLYNLLFFYFANFALFHAYNFWLQSQRQAKTEQQLKELAYQSEIQALKAQIEPHFLFNTLNSISSSVPSSQEHTRILIAQLADTFRYALHTSERQLVPLRDEMEFVKTWLALEQYRIGDRLSIEYQLDENVLSAQIPSLIFQPLIENAIKHGISPKLDGGRVTISILQEGEFVRITVSDTGEGFAGDLSQLFNMGVGLRNACRRLEYLFNQTIRVERGSPGLLFSFKIPFA